MTSFPYTHASVELCAWLHGTEITQEDSLQSAHLPILCLLRNGVASFNCRLGTA